MIGKVVTALRNVVNHPLNRGSKVRVAFDYAASQLAARFVHSDVCVPFPNGTRLMISPQMKGAAHFINPGLCEFEDMCFVMHLLRPGELFVDVGANVGAYTVLASGVAKARTIAFEPGPLAFSYLAANVRLNVIESLAQPVQAAVGAEEGTLRLTDNLGTENYVDPNAISGVDVAVTTLDKALENEAPVLMKIDVEGFETKLFEGAKTTVARTSLKAMIVERAGNASRYGFDEAALHRDIAAKGFQACRYLPLERRLEKLDRDVMGNIIYVKDFDSVQAILRRAEPFTHRGCRI